MRSSQARVRVARVHADTGRTHRADTLAVEEPLEIRVNGTRLAVTMRTPVHDFSLAVGFALSEGIINSADDVVRVRYCQKDQGPKGLNPHTQAQPQDHPDGNGLASELAAPLGLGAFSGTESALHNASDNVVDITLAPHVVPPTATTQRHLVVNSSCGLCGRQSLDEVHQNGCYPIDERSNFTLDEPTVMGLPEQLSEDQKVFAKTGGLHGAGLYDVKAGKMLVVREDVGRHNAVDKVLGWALMERRLPLSDKVLVTSSRASFELVQKAAMAGAPMLVAVSAPSSLAVELAKESDMTLVGFTRGHRCVIYAGEERIVPSTTDSVPKSTAGAVDISNDTANTG
ncbi:MAG TPA: formate dehydrogenase accessory sulfurtransferase FdhD [Candidatus Yaniella excrementavium]|nr:formate dehydrogenase accessory sulfurtransferase FdhD [Candidatus Yaniella excrementavium]